MMVAPVFPQMLYSQREIRRIEQKDKEE